MTTIINLSNTLEEIESKLVWSELTQDAKDFLKSCDSFRIINFGQELLTYNGNQVIGSCGLTQSGTVEGMFHIDNIWTKEGKLF